MNTSKPSQEPKPVKPAKVYKLRKHQRITFQKTLQEIGFSQENAKAYCENFHNPDVVDAIYAKHLNELAS